MYRKFPVIIVFLLFATKIFSQTEFRFEHYTIANGLSSNFTKAIEQDLNGILWIGTIDGLSSFNGYEFTSYTYDDKDTSSLSDNSITDILIDKKGTLWIATNKGINKYLRSSDNFQRFSCKAAADPQDLVVNVMTCDAENNIWLGTDKGIRILNTGNNSIQSPLISDTSLQKFTEEGISSIFFDKQGVLWLGSSIRRGFRMADSKTLQPIEFSPVNKNISLDAFPVTQIYETTNGYIWMLSDNGLYSYNRTSNSIKRFVRNDKPGDTLTYTATSLLEDQKGNIFVSLAANPPYYTSIARVNPDSGTFRIYPYVDNDDRGLAWSWASFIFQDKSGIYWVGTSRGLDKMDPLCQQFKLYQQYTNLKYSMFNNIYSIAKDGNVLWLGSDGKGLLKYHIPSKKFEQIKVPGLDTEIGLYTLLLLKNKNLLLGAPSGVYLYNPSANKSELLISPPTPTGNANSEVSSMMQSDDHIVWIGWHGGGLTKYDLDKKIAKHYRNKASDNTTLCSDQVNTIFKDHQGTIWIGTADGVNVFGGLPGKGMDRFNPETETFTHYYHNDQDLNSLSNNNVICINEDKNGILWVGTRNGGLNMFDPKTGKFKTYTKHDGLPSNFITAIEIDEQNRVWMSSFTNGLSCLNPVNGEIRLFDISYGLQNMRFNRHASFKTDDGEMFFCGVSGFNSFYPSELKFNTVAPEVFINQIKVNNKQYVSDIPIDEIREMKLSYEQSELQFRFVALNYSQTHKNQYAYQLVGYDGEWIQSGTTRTAKYTNLDPGNYTFRVKACNSDGVWNESGVSISICILPPWWKTWWAYVLYGLVLTGSILGFISYRSKALTRENKMLEQKVSERTTQLEESLKNLTSTQTQLIQSEKMASLGELTAGIAHEIQNPLNFVNNFSELSNTLLDELNTEIEKGNKDEVKIITSDLKQNLEKINHHGKRADSIVKSMLLHSRTTTGERKPTDINGLVDEFIRLSYHGLRAKDKTFNAHIKTDYDPNVGTIDTVEQDLGRVILNLTNNAFYAVTAHEKSDDYKPTVSVKTKKLPGKIQISISDNGIGIPQHVLDKIFQPFFTTKPTGQGTGLGLSLSYDVVKAHGGELKVETKEGEGTTFTVELPC